MLDSCRYMQQRGFQARAGPALALPPPPSQLQRHCAALGNSSVAIDLVIMAACASVNRNSWAGIRPGTCMAANH